MSILGTRVVRLEDPRFLRGQGTYIANLDLPGALHLSFVRSAMARARITAIDTSAAASMPGVVAVWTAADIDLAPVPGMFMLNQQVLRPYVASTDVRFVGEPVAVVVSETKEQGVDAAELVIVDYDHQAPVLDLDASYTNASLLHEGTGSNTVLEFAGPPDPATFADCEIVVELTIENQRVAPAPMEVRAAAAVWDAASERLTQWACSQGRTKPT